MSETTSDKPKTDLEKAEQALMDAGFVQFTPHSNAVPPPKDLNHPHYRSEMATVVLDYFANTATIRCTLTDVASFVGQPSEPRFTLEEILPRVEMACRSYIDDDKNAVVQKVVRDSLGRIRESRR